MNRFKTDMLRKRLRLAVLSKRLLMLMQPAGNAEGNGFRAAQQA
ncbi:hypothetical protein [Paenibacillus medicaginis]|uniref:Uncharacterized protein n=1 Tax=Paenibacillus medicaginis TaxID=1470560 RepID=A0ABV5C716_9BACL